MEYASHTSDTLVISTMSNISNYLIEPMVIRFNSSIIFTNLHVRSQWSSLCSSAAHMSVTQSAAHVFGRKCMN